ncbi:hypothetical protein H5392_02920 [Tessaracoccus sp. MC1865]|uniref:hypothetical protein n=1 Tax=Tessaracoccus sp. MC1865 TaxID=2760310 RepID=UPI0016019E9D|nr:hypothetical protein [Tessaracoccus sp. MC1865]MBB1482811.1 hypothetical protein [Tessaracoccus sp. MC1865]QTO37746.1 hypothetical protein J7D54_01170 [Tessaracoccus sp. MC1865]
MTRTAVLSAVAGWLTAKVAFVTLLGIVGTGAVLNTLSQFDAYWYASVMDRGYQWPATGESPLSNLAFFPLVPALGEVFTLAGLTTQQALIAIAVLGSLAAVVGIQRVGARVAGEAEGVWLALLWSLAPRSHVQVMGYSEGPFTALVSWSLWALLTKRPLLAGVFALFAGLTRPTVVPLIFLFGVIMIRKAWSKRKEGWLRALWTKELAGAVLSGLGFLSYWLYVAFRTGHFFGYFGVQAAWKTTLGTPLDTLRFVTANVFPFPEHWRVRHAVLLAVLVYIALLVWMVAKHLDWRLILFVGASMLLTISQQGYFHSYARFMLPLFPLWLPLAMAIPKWPRPVVWVVLLVLFVLSTVWGVDTALMLNSP